MTSKKDVEVKEVSLTTSKEAPKKETKTLVSTKPKEKEKSEKIPLFAPNDDELFGGGTTEHKNNFTVSGKLLELKPFPFNPLDYLKSGKTPNGLYHYYNKIKNARNGIELKHIILNKTLYILFNSDIDIKNNGIEVITYIPEKATSDEADLLFNNVIILLNASIIGPIVEVGFSWDSSRTVQALFYNTTINTINAFYLNASVSVFDSNIVCGVLSIKNSIIKDALINAGTGSVTFKNTSVYKFYASLTNYVNVYTDNEHKRYYHIGGFYNIKNVRFTGVGSIVIKDDLFVSDVSFGSPLSEKSIKVESLSRIQNGYFSGKDTVPFIGTDKGILVLDAEFFYDTFKPFYEEYCNKMGVSGITSEEKRNMGFVPMSVVQSIPSFSNESNGKIYKALKCVFEGIRTSLPHNSNEPNKEFDPNLTTSNRLLFTLATQIYSRLLTIKELESFKI